MSWGDFNVRYFGIVTGAFEKALSDANYPQSIFPLPEPRCDKGARDLNLMGR